MKTQIMSPQERHVNFSTFPMLHCGNGIKMVKYKLSEHLETKEDILNDYLRKLTYVILLLRRNKKSVTVEFPLNTKKMISNVKKSLLENDFPIIELLKMLVLELTGKDQVLKPFWNLQCKENSKQLWLPTETDSADLLLNSFSGSLNTTKSNSWYSTTQFLPVSKNSVQTYCQSSTYSLVDKWEKGGTTKEKVTTSRKVKLRPTPEQQKMLRQWIIASRYTYNQTVHKIEKEKQKVNFYNLRNKLVPKEKVISSRKWLLNTPKDIRANSVRESVTMYKSAFSNLKNKNIKRFKMNFKSRKSWTESIYIPKTAIKVSSCRSQLNIYSRFLKTSVSVSKEKLPDVNNEVTLLHNKKNNSWYLCILVDHEVKTENQGRIVSVDPGVKTFLTLYDPSGKVVQFGTGDMKQTLKTLYLKIDKYRSLLASKERKLYKNQKKKRLRKRIMFFLNKFENLILEIHNKACRFIYSNYDNVLISNISSIRSSRKNNRNLLSWSHGKFVERLTHHMHKNGKRINIVTEEYTSKTCGNCGHIDNHLSNKDVYSCECCKLKISRDVNGARNILLKHLK